MTALRIAALAGAALLSACGGNQSMFNPQGPAARSIAGLGWFLIWLCAAI